MGGGGGGGGSGRMTSEQFFFAAILGLQIIFSEHVPCNFFYRNFFRKGRGEGVKIGSICVSL